MNHSKKLYNGMQSAITRRINVIARLENQLKSGNKIDKSGTSVLLTDNDIKRIKSELSTLKNRI